MANVASPEPPSSGFGFARIKLQTWEALASIAVGLILLAVSFAFAQWVDAFRFVLCTGLGLILAGLGLQVTGTIKSFNVAGGGAAAIVMLLIYYQVAPTGEVSPPRLEATLEGDFPDTTTNLQIEAGRHGEKLFGAWNGVTKRYEFLLEKENLKGGCISFATFYDAPNGSKRSTDTYIAASFFKPFLEARKQNDDEQKQELFLKYVFHEDDKDPKSYIFVEAQEDPKSFDNCTAAVQNTMSEGKQKNKTIFERFFGNITDLFVSPAWAQSAEQQNNQEQASVDEKQIEEWIKDISGSPNVLVRNESQSLLAIAGPTSLKPMMEALRNSPEQYLLQEGVVSVLSKMTNAGVDVQAIRDELTEKDVNIVANLIMSQEVNVAASASSVLSYLHDPRANGTLGRILSENDDVDINLMAATVLNQSFEYFSEPQKEELKTELTPIYPKLEPKVQELIQGIVKYQGPTQLAAEGWVYLGTNFSTDLSTEWDEKYFTSAPGTLSPQIEGTLTATGNVNLRKDHIKFSLEDGWVNAPSIGLIKTNDRVKVEEIKAVAGGYYWAKVKRQ